MIDIDGYVSAALYRESERLETECAEALALQSWDYIERLCVVQMNRVPPAVASWIAKS